MNQEESIYIIITRLFIGEASPREKAVIKGWLNQSSENRKLYTELKEIWLLSGVKNNSDQYKVEKAIQQFKEKIKKEKQVDYRKNIFTRIVKYAAIALLLLALPLSFFIGNRMATIRDSFTTVTCAFGDKTTLILPDSSLVWLNSGSKLSFNNNFNNGSRQVYLEGEAYFSVMKDKKNPFRVKTSKINVEVLGTEFNLKAYTDDKDVVATLVEGSIAIASPFQKTKIKPMQKLVYDKENQKMIIYNLNDTSCEINWKDGRLVFHNESLADLELKLERWFDVDIVFADDEVKKRCFTGTLERESILETISYFGLSQYVQYKIEGNKIIFYSNN